MKSADMRKEGEAVMLVGEAPDLTFSLLWFASLRECSLRRHVITPKPVICDSVSVNYTKDSSSINLVYDCKTTAFSPKTVLLSSILTAYHKSSF